MLLRTEYKEGLAVSSQALDFKALLINLLPRPGVSILLLSAMRACLGNCVFFLGLLLQKSGVKLSYKVHTSSRSCLAKSLQDFGLSLTGICWDDSRTQPNSCLTSKPQVQSSAWSPETHCFEGLGSACSLISKRVHLCYSQSIHSFLMKRKPAKTSHHLQPEYCSQ